MNEQNPSKIFPSLHKMFVCFWCELSWRQADRHSLNTVITNHEINQIKPLYGVCVYLFLPPSPSFPFIRISLNMV